MPAPILDTGMPGNAIYSLPSNSNTPNTQPTGSGNSGSFSISPDAGIYGSESAAALSAYQAAQSQLLAQRNSLYNQYGFTQSGLVDPNNPYGQYQQLLGSEGHQLDADMADAAGRNLGTGGLAHQQESYDRAQQGATNMQFQRQVGDVATNYGLGLQSAKASYDQALAQAQSDAMMAALQEALANMGNNGSSSSSDSGGSSNSPGNYTQKQIKSGTTNYKGVKGPSIFNFK